MTSEEPETREALADAATRTILAIWHIGEPGARGYRMARFDVCTAGFMVRWSRAGLLEE